MAEALANVGQYIDESRRLLQDQVAPYRYPDLDIVEALNIGLQEARRLRADLFLPAFSIPQYDPTKTSPGTDRNQPVPFDPMYRSALVYYIVGRMQARDDEATEDQRAIAFLGKFVQQLLVINS